jgi:hypothetical protein
VWFYVESTTWHAGLRLRAETVHRQRSRARAFYLRLATGGAVFSLGSINWSGSLPHNGFANNVARITENVLRRFADFDV